VRPGFWQSRGNAGDAWVDAVGEVATIDGRRGVQVLTKGPTSSTATGRSARGAGWRASAARRREASVDVEVVVRARGEDHRVYLREHGGHAA